MNREPAPIASLTNTRVKGVVKLRQRSHRDELGVWLVEGYREIKRAVDNGHPLREVYFCPALFQGVNETALLDACRAAGAELRECTEPVFRKMAYRERPEGLLALAAPAGRRPADLKLPADPLLVVAESIEKPGNLGTILRSADGAGVDGVLVCDRCTDLGNPNVVRASIGTVFAVPVVETSTDGALAFLAARGLRTVAATPHAATLYTDADLTGGVAIVVGSEQYGLSPPWLEHASALVRIPMLGQADSLNVASATALLLYEAVRQRGLGKRAPQA